MRLYRRLLFVATVLAFAVIALGAYVRLSDAGLGCPDWPGCYGHWLGVPEQLGEQAQQAWPQRPLESGKAWKEMVHRYFAGTLGLLILALCLLAWRAEFRRIQSPALPTLLLGIVGLQAALGMWTVTLLLKPLIVTLHLLGGMTTLALLLALVLKKPSLSADQATAEDRIPAGAAMSGPTRAEASAAQPGAAAPNQLRWLAAVALLAVVGQIALGGWVSSNYAALACPDFPRCQGQWQPSMDFSEAFAVHRELGQTADGALLSNAALTAIHWSHRLGALAVLVAVGTLAVRLAHRPEAGWRYWGIALLGLLAVQIGLGIANVLLALPLPLAVAHNLGAAALLSATLAINLRLRRAG